jgi:cyclopropane fatty-acyl-phospholipid synthase-like methyltransferase
MSQYDVYGRMAAAGVTEILQNGRYISQKEAEQYVPDDIVKKLKINRDDTFFDIGCGLGLNLIPISKIVRLAFACDHPSVIKMLCKKDLPTNINFYEGDFLNITTNRSFTKILAYSVLTALENEKTLFSFIDKTLTLLAPEGRMLLGDFANIDKKSRFLSSKRGKLFNKNWIRLNSKQENEEDVSIYQTENDSSLTFNDALILKILEYIRDNNFHAYVLDQPQNLPFGNSREDILVVGHEYEDKE